MKTNLKRLFLAFILLCSVLFLTSCNEKEDDVGTANPMVMEPICDGQWICYPDLGYARCNGDLREPKVDYDEVC